MDAKKSTGFKLSVATLAIMNVTAVVSLRGLPAEAVYGLSSAFYYLFAAVVFLIPTAMVAAELAAIEAGAQDFEPSDEGNTLFVTDLTDLDAVCKALPEQGFTVNSAKIGYMPKNPVSNLTPEQLEEVEAFLEALDNHDDVQNVYVGLSG